MRGLDTFFADVLETFSNAVLGLDPESPERLRILEGRSLQFESSAPQQVLTLTVRDARIVMLAEPVDTPNVIVRGRMQDLLAWFAATSQASQTNQRVEIDGDETTLFEVMDVFKRFAPDPGYPFNNFIASEIGQNLLGAAELAIAGLRSAVEGAGSAMQQSAANQYLDQSHVNAFLERLEDLRLRVDRLAARVGAAEADGV